MRYIFYLLFTSTSFLLHAQEDSVQISTDRPGFSDSPQTIPKGYFQLEAGFSFQSETVNPTDKLQLMSWNNTLVKYGIINGWELRLSQTYQTERLLEAGNTHQFVWQSYSGPVVVGTKIDLLTEDGLVPQTAILVEYGFNTHAFETTLNNSFFRAQLSSKYQLNPDWYILANIGYDKYYSGFDRWRYTLNTGYTLTDKLSAYIEIYGYKSETLTPLNYFDGGFTYLINPKFQLDIHAGIDLVQQLNNTVDYQQSFVAMGLAYLFKIKQ